jgi:hypothetical protein
VRRWPLILALTLAFATGAPFLLGHGVDVPDDALYYELASWEWLRFAWLDGRSPWFVGGKLGGVSLFVDTVPMGPFYPAMALLAVLPAGTALPVSALLHALGVVVAVRWFALTLGASPLAASLAGAAVAVGPVGTFGFVDARGIAWATLLWLPVALAAFEHARKDPVRRGRWLALCGAALALLLLGSHVRLSTAALAVFCLWALSSGRSVVFAIPPLLLALVAGAPGYVPLLAEWGQASSSAGLAGKLSTLSAPAESGMTLASLPGLLAPRPWPSYADYGIGVVLGVAGWMAVGTSTLSPKSPAGRAAGLAILLLLAALSPSLGPLRWLFAPLLVLTHPVDDVFSALAMVPAAAAAAVAFDAIVRGDVPFSRARAGVALLLAGSGVALLTEAPHLFRDDRALALYRLALVQAAITIPAALLLLRLRRPKLAAILALLELGLIAIRLHTAVPSPPLPLHGRTDVQGIEALAGGYLDIDDLARLEPFRYEAVPDEPDPPEFWEDTAEAMQDQILHRRWPAHLGLARGYRGLSGRAKLMPSRQVEALTPLVDDISGRAIGGEDLRELFEDRNQIGARTLSLFGIPVAAAPDGIVLTAPDQSPPCYSPSAAVYLADPQARVAAVLGPGWSAEQAEAVVESPELAGRVHRAAEVTCAEDGATVDARSEAVVVFRERYHPGWIVRSGDAVLPTFPVNVVHTGVFVRSDQDELGWSFEPPGLRASLASSVLGWLFLFGLALRRSHADSTPDALQRD